MGQDYSQRPSSILIPRAPRYLQWWLDEATLHLASAQREQAASPNGRGRSPEGVGTVEGNTVHFTGETIPWLEQDEYGNWRRVARK